MRLQRGKLALHGERGHELVAIEDRGSMLTFSPDDLRWLCLVAGPALLNELGKEATNGND
jgi:hypothetical protein